MLVSDTAFKVIQRALGRMLSMVMLMERAEDRQPDKENRNGRQRCEQTRPWAGHHALELYHNWEATASEIIEAACRPELAFSCQRLQLRWKRRTSAGTRRHEPPR